MYICKQSIIKNQTAKMLILIFTEKFSYHFFVTNNISFSIYYQYTVFKV